jgi:hypothetical protein
MIKPLPCPCCGNTNLYTGKTMSVTLGVECNLYMDGCGLSIGRVYPKRMPRGVKDLKGLDEVMLKRAIQAWNRRSPVKG